ncbi:MAG: Hpt domain-containing protein [Lachnospiraceae bacterium]|nr:Hpt domain-containing protein [Lachnospiraceae bacterium]MBR4992918.1 Hpt domain-containing protein [Lachnospiraceae bacterium]
MNEEGKKGLIEAGVDFDGALHRFLNNESMYEKFLVKFPDDVNFGNILSLQEQGKYEDIFSFSHTLKGTAGNLGLEPVRVVASSITELIRGKAPADIDREAVDRQIALLKDEYAKMCDAIRRIQ